MKPALSPNPPKTLPVWLRRIAWSILWLVTIVCLAGSIFSAYTRHRFQEAVTKAKAVGMPDSWEEVIGTPVPAEDNFGSIEDFKPFLSVEQVECPVSEQAPFGTKLKYLDEKGMEPLKAIKPLKISGGTPKSFGPFEATSIEDLRKKAISEKRLPEDSSGLTDGEAVHKTFEDLAPLWSRLHAAKHRTHAVLYSPLSPNAAMAGSPMISPSINLNLAHVAQLKARASIRANRGADALEECLLLAKIAELRTFSTLIEHLVRTTEISLLMPPLHEGISHRVWTDAELGSLERQLARYDLLAELRNSLGSETLFSRDFYKVMQSGSGRTVSIGAILTGAQAPEFEKFLLSTFSKTAANILCTATVESAIHHSEILSQNRRANLRAAALTHPDLHWGPLDKFAGNLLPALNGVLKSTGRVQSFVNLARIGIALERHRLNGGTHPKTLPELVPAYLPAVPVEVFDGESYKYVRKPDNQGFILYSTGWKGTDDGGEMNYSKPNETNWVWDGR